MSGRKKQAPPFSKLREHYKKLIVQDTIFIDTFGTPEQKVAWNSGKDVLHTANQKKLLVNTGNMMGSIRDEIHTRNLDSTEYRLLFLQHGPHKYEDIKRDLGKDIADTIQKLRDAAQSEKKE